TRLAAVVSLQIAGLIAVVLEYEMNMAVRGHRASNGICQLREDMGDRVVHDGMNRVKPQPVEVILLQPVQRVMNEEIANGPALWSVEIDAITPGAAVPLGKELRRIRSKIVSFRAEMVVHNIQQNHHAAKVSRLYKPLEIFRTPINAVRSVAKDAVVSPI